MLGDAGANALGAALGVGALLTLGPAARLVLTAVLAVLNVAADGRLVQQGDPEDSGPSTASTGSAACGSRGCSRAIDTHPGPTSPGPGNSARGDRSRQAVALVRSGSGRPRAASAW